MTTLMRPARGSARSAREILTGPGHPVILSPMAGVTERAFRTLCGEYGADICVSEMITSRALVEQNPKTMRMIGFGRDESPRSIQLYGVDPQIIGDAVRWIVDHDAADHIDLNFGCPVPKVTAKGGGSALPWKTALFAAIVGAAVRAAGTLPVTVKIRKGIDPDHLTYRDAGRVAADCGAAAVFIHGRTTLDGYSGDADWACIADLVELLAPLPVYGNGDIWAGPDAVRMVEQTGCSGVVVGRGCLGRPWVFAEIAAAFAGSRLPSPPRLGEVGAIISRHARMMAEDWGEFSGCQMIRKHIAWYFKGFSVPHEIRVGLASVTSLAQLDDLVGQLDPDQPYPIEFSSRPRGRTAPRKRVALPDGWLANRQWASLDRAAERDDSGG